MTSILFLLLIVLVSIFSKTIFNDQNLYYYIFSTIVQGFLALVAFLGTVVIYKLQIIETDLNATANKAEPSVENFVGITARTLSWVEIMNEANKILDAPAGNKNYDEEDIDKLAIFSLKLSSLSKERGLIRSRMVDFSLLSFLNVGFSLIAMPISKLLVTKELYIGGETLVLIGITVSFISMIYAFRIIRAVLGYSFSAHF